jgi:uncharacterized protein (UPF0335 family)
MTIVYTDFDLSNAKDVQFLNDITNIENYKNQISELNKVIEENKKNVNFNSQNMRKIVELQKRINEMLITFDDLKKIVESKDINKDYIEPFKVISDFLYERLNK